ncbi:MAG: hypothetical protein NTV46_00235 [Verrucomicrobia bacterium]|nr:hypothetical protein [Verrucomicrobiota bacterium]
MNTKGALIAFTAALLGVAGGGFAGYTVADRASARRILADLSIKTPRQDTTVLSTKAGSETPVIAVLVGYESSMELSTGQKIDYFTPDPAHAFGDVFLFSVLVPNNLAGQLFVVQDRSGPMNQDPSRIFRIGTRYRFSLKTGILLNPWTLDTQFSLVWPGVKEAPITKEEVDAYTGRLEESMESTKKNIAWLENRIKYSADAAHKKHYEKAKADKEKYIAFLESAEQKVFSLLNDAKDDYPDVIDLKWHALNDEGWGPIPRAPDPK